MKLFLATYILRLFYPIFYLIYALFYRSKKIIIFSSCHLDQYNRNTRYLYEYLTKNKKYTALWLTSSVEVMDYLRENHYPFIYAGVSLKTIVYFFSASAFVTPGNDIYDPFKLLRKSALKVCVGHGSGPKLVRCLDDYFIKTLSEIKSYRKFDYVNFPSDYVIDQSGLKQYLIPKDNLINLGYPRNDQFFTDSALHQKTKPLYGYLTDNKFTKNKKIIFYTPTWRTWGYQNDMDVLPIESMKDFSWPLFDDFLLSKDAIFFISLHSLNTYKSLPLSFSSIHIIDSRTKHLFDTTAFMLETNMLINDYSTTSTDYVLLKKPQIFVMPDYDTYNQKKGFLENYKKIIPGDEVSDFEDFQRLIDLYLDKPNVYYEKYSSKIDYFQRHYYDLNHHTSVLRFEKFFDSVL